MPAPYNQPVQILQVHTAATAYLVGEIEAFILVLTLMNVLKDRTAAHPTHAVSIHKARTNATACLVGETMVLILAAILMNVPKQVTDAQPTHIVLIHKDHTDVIATDVSTNLEVVAMVCIGYDHTSMVNSLSMTFKATSY